MNNNYTILVNTCDKFEDCWYPFFKLFSIYWSDYKGKIYLNTEYKDFSYSGLNIVCTKVCEVNNVPRNKKATWSQCLNWALQQVDSEILLYMQEDYFLNDFVNSNLIAYFSDTMLNNSAIPCIHLTNSGIPAVQKSDFQELYYSDPNYFSYVSCQASFWRKGIILSLLRAHETAWNFEWWGSKRAKYLGYRFFVVDSNKFSSSPNVIISYILTGVIGGKWHKPVVELFDRHDIVVDYSKRGFYDVNLRPIFKKKVITKLSIWKLQSIFEILKLKYIMDLNGKKLN
jgi:hypothetical protein